VFSDLGGDAKLFYMERQMVSIGADLSVYETRDTYPRVAKGAWRNQSFLRQLGFGIRD
jgi:hypothetical protein